MTVDAVEAFDAFDALDAAAFDALDAFDAFDAFDVDAFDVFDAFDALVEAFEDAFVDAFDDEDVAHASEATMAVRDNASFVWLMRVPLEQILALGKTKLRRTHATHAFTSHARNPIAREAERPPTKRELTTSSRLVFVRA